MATAAIYLGHIAPFIYSDDWAMFTALASGKMGAAAISEPWLSVPSWNYFRPVAALSVQADFLAFGASPIPMHVIALLLLVLCGAAAGWLAALFTGGRVQVAATTAFCFVLLHPAVVESVAWLTCRANLLSGLLSIVAVCCGVRYSRGGGRHYLVLAFGAALLAMFAKEDGIAAVGLLVIVAWSCGDFRRGALLTVTALLAVGSLWAVRALLGIAPDLSAYLTSGETAVERLPARMLRHLAMIFWPHFTGTPAVVTAGIGILVAMVLVLGWRRPHRTRWITLSILVVVGLAPAMASDVHLTSGARTLFIPILLAASWFGVALAGSPIRGRPAIALAALLVTFATIVTLENLGRWRDAGRYARRIATALRSLHEARPAGETFVFVERPCPPDQAPSVGGAVAHMLRPPFTASSRPLAQGPEELLREVLGSPSRMQGVLTAVAWSDGFGLIHAPLPQSESANLFVWSGDTLRQWSRTTRDRLRSPPIGVSALCCEYIAADFARETGAPAKATLFVQTPYAKLTCRGNRRGTLVVFPIRSLPYASPVDRIDRLAIRFADSARYRIERIRWVSRIRDLTLYASWVPSADGKKVRLVVEFDPIEEEGAFLTLHVFTQFGELLHGDLKRSDIRPGSGERWRWQLELSRAHLAELGVLPGTDIFLQLEVVEGRESGVVLSRSRIEQVKMP